jgi:hypothetical protein
MKWTWNWHSNSIELGNRKLDQKSFKEAEAHFKYSIEKVNMRNSTAAVMVKEKLSAISGLITSYLEQRKLGDAANLLREKIEIVSRSEDYGDPHPDTLELGCVLLKKGDLLKLHSMQEKGTRRIRRWALTAWTDT